MNREVIEPGRSLTKLAETFAIFGGAGALVYPLVFYYAAWVTIDSRDDFLYCQVKTQREKQANDEDYNDYVRECIQWNFFLMCLYLIFHFLIYQRPLEDKTFRGLGAAFGIICCLEIVIAVIVLIFLAGSICKDESNGSVAVIQGFAIIIVNAFVIVASTVFFLLRTRTRNA